MPTGTFSSDVIPFLIFPRGEPCALTEEGAEIFDVPEAAFLGYARDAIVARLEKSARLFKPSFLYCPMRRDAVDRPIDRAEVFGADGGCRCRRLDGEGRA